MNAIPNLSLLASLRAVVPPRKVVFAEALRLAELQASKLIVHLDTSGSESIEQHLLSLPRLRVHYADLPVSGLSHWNGQRWIITLAGSDGPARQRFTLLHEFKHIIDHGHKARLYPGDRLRSPDAQAEAAADYFAGCALVPKRQLKSAWGSRIQRVSDLAAHFGVSEAAIRVRLAQTGLDAVMDRLPSSRCARPTHTPNSKPQRFRLARAPRSYA